MRVSTWLAGAVGGPVIAAIIVAAVLKLTGLDSTGEPVNPSSPAVGSNVLKASVYTVGLHQDYSIVFPRPYVLNGWQRVHTRSLEAIGNNIDRLDQSLIASGGGYRGAMVIMVTITNLADKAAQIVDASIVDRHLTSPWAGTLVYLPPQGNVGPSKMIFNLDRVHPVAENLGRYDRRIGGAFFSNSVIKLPPGEPTTVRVIAATDHHGVSFRIAFKYVVNGISRMLVVGQGSRPFTLSATACTSSRAFPYQRIYSVFYSKGFLQAMSPQELRAAQSADRRTLCAPIR